MRSAIDCLTAQIAIEHKLILQHIGKNFERIAELAPALRLYKAQG